MINGAFVLTAVARLFFVEQVVLDVMQGTGTEEEMSLMEQRGELIRFVMFRVPVSCDKCFGECLCDFALRDCRVLSMCIALTYEVCNTLCLSRLLKACCCACKQKLAFLLFC